MGKNTALYSGSISLLLCTKMHSPLRYYQFSSLLLIGKTKVGIAVQIGENIEEINWGENNHREPLVVR